MITVPWWIFVAYAAGYAFLLALIVDLARR